MSDMKSTLRKTLPRTLAEVIIIRSPCARAAEMAIKDVLRRTVAALFQPGARCQTGMQHVTACLPVTDLTSLQRQADKPTEGRTALL